MLVDRGYVPRRVLLLASAKHFGLPAVGLHEVEVQEQIVKLIPKDLVFRYLVFPLETVGRVLKVAMVNPLNTGAIGTLKFVTRFEIDPVVNTEYDLQQLAGEGYDRDDYGYGPGWGPIINDDLDELEDVGS